MSPLQQFLDSQPLGNGVKADVWDHFQEATNPEDFQRRFDPLNIPQETKAHLWDMKFGAPQNDPPRTVQQAAPPKSLNTTAAKIGSAIPDWAVSPLQAGQKYLVDPFEKMAKWGAQEGASAAETILSSPPAMPYTAPGSLSEARTPRSTIEQDQPVASGVAKGVGSVVGGIVADPRNWPFLAKSVAQPVLRRLISAGFTGMIGKGTVQGAQQLHDNWDTLTPAQRAEYATQTGLSALMTLGAAHGMVERTPIHPAEAESLKGNPTEEVNHAERPQAEPITGPEISAVLKGSPDLPPSSRNAADLMAASEVKETAYTDTQRQVDREKFLSMTKRYSDLDETPIGQIAKKVDSVLQESPADDTRNRKAISVATSLGKPGESPVHESLHGLVGLARAAVDRITRPPEDTDFMQAVGRYSGGITRTKFDTNKFSNEIRQEIPDKTRREGVTNWIQADGDEHTLRQRADQTTDTKLKHGYLAALDLTPEEKDIAQNVRSYFGLMLRDAKQHDMLDHGVENYVNQVWEDTKSKAPSGFQTNPSFTKKRVHENFFAGEQSGLKPKTKDIAELVGIYNKSFGTSLASRGLVSDLSNAKAKDGRPVVVPSGMGHIVEGEEKGAVLVKPFGGLKSEYDDYRILEHSAFRKWKYTTTTPEGRPVLVQGDMYVHPDHYDGMRKLFEPSRIRQSAIGRGALNVSSVLKNTLLVGPFHAVQEGRRAVQYGINPIHPPEVDLTKPALKKLTDAGLTLSGDGLQNFQEGVYGDGGLLRKVPILNRVIHEIGSFTFDHYIPKLKAAAGEKLFEENKARYQKELDSGKLSEFQIARTTAEQVNATFGGLNSIMDGRSKTTQDVLRLMMLAPDFLESTGRAVGQSFTRYGGAQRKAILGYGILGSWVMYRALNQLIDNDPHFEKPFAVVHGGEQYGLRGFGEDLGHLLEDPRQFLYRRANPTTVRPLVQLATGRDEYGRSRTMGEQIEDYIKSVTPIPAQSALTRLFDPGDREQSLVDSVFASLGLNKYKYRTPATEVARKLYYDTHTMRADNPESRDVSRIRGQFQEGKVTTKDLIQLVKARKLTPQQAGTIVREKGRTELDYFTSQLRLDQVIRVWDKASLEEQKQLKAVLVKKIGELKNYDDQKRAVLMREIRSRLIGQK
jgi:hypothetical protein